MKSVIHYRCGTFLESGGPDCSGVMVSTSLDHQFYPVVERSRDHPEPEAKIPVVERSRDYPEPEAKIPVVEPA